MTRHILTALVCAASLAASAGIASAATHKPPRHHHVYQRQAEGQIACTVFGCQRIPPNCHPATQYYWNGMPTGYDRVVCR
jgi:hypothetical protein